MEALFVAFFY